ncbi:probable Mediator of RNA polymerase II transcription subunit 31 [Melanopsichium pennsylvanicum]|uniref:Mediator of RNA polymerase II transcription subunit 31 n=2 Tax=Melanopsichium pennsylvanicum TaxID=63383 RepID=A0AAJ4XRQ1_9BASI|nr:related to mediator complex subunit soh1 [Melanopsichium pennsylvanicum 4]SNX86676.1 probable Mediator of RNA polymerase II transcription subunit 31 [Melanopsichium pennsylvanicum]
MTTTEPAPVNEFSPDESKTRQENQTKFSRDLEFLSSLANPYYLNHLALSGVLSSPAFLRYLKYLDYFRHPQYVKYLQYPQALHFLDLLQNEEEFRLALRDAGFVGEVMSRQVAHWATWRDPEALTNADEDAGEGEGEIVNGVGNAA